jgi:hypothetical protein
LVKNETMKLTLGDDVRFFFTVELTGCRIQVGGVPTRRFSISLATAV